MASILIVDDLISIHEMLEAVIQPSGHKTAFATDGEKALVRYKAEKFDLVLADIDMKPMDGITLLKQLKQYDPGAVVVVSFFEHAPASNSNAVAAKSRRVGRVRIRPPEAESRHKRRNGNAATVVKVVHAHRTRDRPSPNDVRRRSDGTSG